MMTFEEAKMYLKDVAVDDGLFSLGWYVGWNGKRECNATLDGQFSADDLEAISVYMKAPASVRLCSNDLS